MGQDFVFAKSKFHETPEETLRRFSLPISFATGRYREEERRQNHQKQLCFEKDGGQ
jgi:hypothetical protein